MVPDSLCGANHGQPPDRRAPHYEVPPPTRPSTPLASSAHPTLPSATQPCDCTTGDSTPWSQAHTRVPSTDDLCGAASPKKFGNDGSKGATPASEGLAQGSAIEEGSNATESPPSAPRFVPPEPSSPVPPPPPPPLTNILELPRDAHPYNFPLRRKLGLTVLASLIFFNGAVGSSAPTGASRRLSSPDQLDSPSRELTVLVLSVYMLGFVVAPSVWAPMSERLGRRSVNLASLPGFSLFALGCSFARDMPTLIVLRFFMGFCAAAPLSNSGATISDVWIPSERVWPMISYTAAALFGPIAGPVLGGFLGEVSADSWRWIFRVLCLQSASIFLLVLAFQVETYVPVLLVRHARALRAELESQTARERRTETGQGAEKDRGSASTEKTSPSSSSSSSSPSSSPESRPPPRVVAPLEASRLRFSDVVRDHLLRPLSMLLTEPIVAYAAAWMSFVYGLVFLFFEAMPVVFAGVHGFAPGEVGLAFVPLGIGILASLPVVHRYNHNYLRLRSRSRTPVPEARLEMTGLSAPLFVVGFLIFGWTARPEIHWAVPMIGEVMIGAGMIFAFNSLSVYTTECYGRYVASALAALAIARSVFAVVFPLFGRQLFEWSIPYASTILAAICLAFVPVPFLFNRYGARIRSRSRMALKDDE